MLAALPIALTRCMLKACLVEQGIDKQQLMLDVKDALYAAKITSYAQGMNIIRAKSEAMGWNIDLGGLARIWKVCPFHVPCCIVCCRGCCLQLVAPIVL